MRLETPAGIDLFAPGFLAEPWAAYRRLHAAGEVLWHPAHKSWLVPGHAAARTVLRGPAFAVYAVGELLEQLGRRAGRDFPALCRMLAATPLLHNSPTHGAVRRFVGAVLAAQPISSLAPAMREIAARLLAPARAAAGFDAVLDFAERLPSLVMARLLGFADADAAALQAMSAGVIGVFNRAQRLSEYAALEARAAQALEFFRALAAERRRAPRDDGLSRMVAARAEGRALPDEEIAAYALVTYLVGVETTAAFIGSAIRGLLEQPELHAALRRDRAPLKDALEELLRRETPVQVVRRAVLVEQEIAGQRLQPGERVLVMLGAANRDPRAYPEPDRFELRRAGPPHLAFIEGPHVCLGAALARSEAHAALDALLDLPPLRRASRAPPERWWPYDWLRRVRELPLEFA